MPGHKIYTVDTDLIVIDSSLRLCSSAVSYLLTLALYQVNRNTANMVCFLMLNDLNGHINTIMLLFDFGTKHKRLTWLSCDKLYCHKTDVWT